MFIEPLLCIRHIAKSFGWSAEQTDMALASGSLREWTRCKIKQNMLKKNLA